MPKYGQWTYHIARKWDPPQGVNKPAVIGFAIILASFERDGTIYPAAETLAKHAGIHPRNARRRRTECVRLGLFRDTGRTFRRIPILERSLPPRNPELPPIPAIPHEGDHPSGACPGCVAVLNSGGNSARMSAEHWEAMDKDGGNATVKGGDIVRTSG